MTSSRNERFKQCGFGSRQRDLYICSLGNIVCTCPSKSRHINIGNEGKIQSLSTRGHRIISILMEPSEELLAKSQIQKQATYCDRGNVWRAGTVCVRTPKLNDVKAGPRPDTHIAMARCSSAGIHDPLVRDDKTPNRRD
jgi:hypothetical protein